MLRRRRKKLDTAFIKAIRRLFAKAEGIKLGGVNGGRKKLDTAFREGVAETKLGRQILRLNIVLVDGDIELAETLLEEIEDEVTKDWFSKHLLLSLKLQQLEEEKRKIEIEQLKLKGEYGICRICGEEREYVYGPSSLTLADEREICKDCLDQKELKKRMEENHRRIESGALFRKPKGWGGEKVDELAETLNGVFKEVPISVESFTQIQDLLDALAEEIGGLVEASYGDDL